ncbi:MAG: hypothetical protein KTR32_23995 [Granulosicoccus sp.]|nr:hypothetical protein [Granulosicoccus sp.]
MNDHPEFDTVANVQQLRSACSGYWKYEAPILQKKQLDAMRTERMIASVCSGRPANCYIGASRYGSEADYSHSDLMARFILEYRGMTQAGQLLPSQPQKIFQVSN